MVEVITFKNTKQCLSSMNMEELTRDGILEFEYLLKEKLDLICFHNHKEGDIYKFFTGKAIFGKITWYKISHDRIQEILIYSAPKH